MRILHVIASVDPRGGGPVEGVLQQARAREESKSAFTHIATLDDPSDPWVQSCDVKTFALGPTVLSQSPLRRYIPWARYGYAPKIVPWLKTHVGEYDVVVVNGLWNYSTLAARRALVRSQHPYVVFSHGMLDPWFRKQYPLKHFAKQILWLFSEGPLLNNAKAVLFTSEDERDLAEGAFWPYEVKEHVVAYGTADITGDATAQVMAFRATVPELGNRQFLLLLSRIHPKKGCDLLIDAFGAVASGYPGLDLVIAGPDQMGWQRELMAKARQLGIETRIHWPGMLTGEAKWGAFRSCEAFVLPSHQENFGIVVAEAMAAAKPVLISEKVNIWREVKESGSGIVASDDLEGAKTMLEGFLSLKQEEKVAMGAAARRTFLKCFEMTKVAGAIVATLKAVSR